MAVIYGSSRSERLTGTSSSDTIYAFGGNDTIIGGGGFDVIYAGSGNNIITVGGDFPRPSGNRIITEGGDNHITLGRVSAVNTVELNRGSNTVLGAQSDDQIIVRSSLLTDRNFLTTGGGGNDTIVGGFGADTIDARGFGHGTLRIDGGYGNDIIHMGYARHGTFLGGEGDDVFTIGVQTQGYNHIDGGAGIDVMVAREHNAVLSVSSITGIEAISRGNFTNLQIRLERPTESSAAPPADSPATFDFSDILLDGVATIQGKWDSERIFTAGAFEGDDLALASNDFIQAGEGNDFVHAGYGDDIIDAGIGDDTVYGGTGNDTFIFQRSIHLNVTTIADFSLTESDTISVRGFSGIGFSDLQALMTVQDDATAITLAPNNVIRLVGIEPDQLTASDFTFA